MNHRIKLHNDLQIAVDATRLKMAAARALQAHDMPARALTIVISDAASVRELNQRHRGIDAPTDVLAFPAPDLPPDAADDLPYLGDIVIAHDYAAATAQSQGADLGDALGLLVAHATLHLLGYDHDTESARESMWAAQAEILRALDIDAGIASRYGGGDA